jgi:hypothetical protein
LDTFLLNYRATPHAMTGVSPAKSCLDARFGQRCLR